MEVVPDFDYQDTKSYCDFFASNGYVVIRNVLEQHEYEASIDEMWKTLKMINPGISRDDPASWDNETWPSRGVGFLDPPVNDCCLPQAWKNRQNPKIVEVFRTLLGCQEIYVKRDRFNIMRPTKNIKLADGSVVQRDEWKTKNGWLHWDQNPWTERDAFRLQGMLLFTDQTATSGGFDCVPKFNLRWKDWGVNNPPDPNQPSMLAKGVVPVPETDPMWNEVQHITCKAGSLIIWDSKMPHQNYPNDDEHFRMLQYITFHVHTPEEVAHMRENLYNQVKCGFVPKNFIASLSDLGRKVACYESYNENEKFDFDTLELYDNALEAYAFLQQASNAEKGGNPELAASFYRRAYKLNPVLEELEFDI